jgi:alkaline phosphatase D
MPQFSSQPFPFFTTFPPVGSARDFQFVVLADFGSVAKLSAGVETFRSAVANLPAFVFIGGDFDHSNPQTLADKRQMLRNLYDPQTRFMSDFVPSILRHMPIARQWDDHDSGLNNLDKNYPDWSLTQQAFLEYTPTYPLPSVTPGIWQQFGYAQADFCVLDCRSQRDPGLDPGGPDKSMLDGNNLGATGELEWLKNGLLTSAARWKIIFTSVVTNPTTKQNDGWGAYPTEWHALRSFITTNDIQNVVFIAGDLHLGAIDCTWERSTTAARLGFPKCASRRPTKPKPIPARQTPPERRARDISSIPARDTAWSPFCKTQIVSSCR